MLSLIGLPIIVAAWAVPALFLVAVGGLLGFAVGRPVYRIWARGFDRLAGFVARLALRAAEGLASRSYDHAVSHVRGDR